MNRKKTAAALAAMGLLVQTSSCAMETLDEKGQTEEQAPAEEHASVNGQQSVVDRLDRGDYLFEGQKLVDPNCYYSFVMQSDGNAVTYVAGWWPMWATNTQAQSGSYIGLQWDQNFVLYNRHDQPWWATNTVGRGVDSVVQQTDANLVAYWGTHPVWASNTVDNAHYFCDQSNQTGSKTRVTTGKDLWGGDYRSFGADRWSACGTECARDSQCKAFTYYSGTCFLKNVEGLALTSLTGATSGRIIFYN